MGAEGALRRRLKGLNEAEFRERSAGRRGRGSAGKTLFVAAVETTAERKPRRIWLPVVKACRKNELERLGKAGLEPNSNVVRDGLSGWTAVKAAGCVHFPMVTGAGSKAAKWPPFKWVNTSLGNIKTALAGTYHHLGPKHAQRCLVGFACRFNRCFQLNTLTKRLAWAAARTSPQPTWSSP